MAYVTGLHRIANQKKHRVNHRDIPSYPTSKALIWSSTRSLILARNWLWSCVASVRKKWFPGLCTASENPGVIKRGLLENHLLAPFSSMGFPIQKTNLHGYFLISQACSMPGIWSKISWTRGILLEAFRQPNLSAKCVQSSVQSVGWEHVDMSDMSIKTI